MNKRFSFYAVLLTILILLYNINLFSQEKTQECKVLLNTIDTLYNGDCKNGLAHGKGVAEGIDRYEGKFKFGLPHGHGEYVWKNGDVYNGNWKNGKRDGIGIMYTDSSGKEIKAHWKKDKFLREIITPPYQIMLNKGVRVTFLKESDNDNNVQIILKRMGNVPLVIDSFSYLGSSGTYTTYNDYVGYDGVEFPFEGKLRFHSTNQLNTAFIEYMLRFKINEKGSWKLVITF